MHHRGISLEEIRWGSDLDSNGSTFGKRLDHCKIGPRNAQVTHTSGSYTISALNLGGSDKRIPACETYLCIHGDCSQERGAIVATFICGGQEYAGAQRGFQWSF